MRYSKWRVDKNELDVDSVVLITDHVNKETGLPALGLIKEKHSDRSFTVSYIKRPAELDKHFNVTRKALTRTLERPNTKLVRITSLDELKEGELNIDPFDATVATDASRPAADLADEEEPQRVLAPAADEPQDDGDQDAPAPVGDVEDAEHVHVPSRAHSPVDGDEAQPAPEPDPAPARDQQVATPQDGGQQQPRQPPVAMKFISGKGVDVIKDLPKRKKK